MGFTTGFYMSDDLAQTINIVISSNVNNLNLFTLFGSKTDQVEAILTINDGVTVSSASVANPAITTGSGWNPLSKLTIVNNGNIYGRGGNGGNGSNWSNNPSGFPSAPTAGGKGGSAIQLLFPTSIKNLNGNVYGGGGGGGAGQFGYGDTAAYGEDGIGGSSGGGGAPFGLAGINGASSVGRIASISGNDAGALVGGSGGGGRSDGQFSIGYASGAAGKGGDVGFNGESGGFGQFHSPPFLIFSEPYSTIYERPSAGGSVGDAVVTNGFSLTWIDGNNASQVKGAIL